MDSPRTQAWLDELTGDEYAVARRVLDMDGGDMASSFVAVMAYRVEMKVDELPRLVAAAVEKRMPKPIHGDLLTAMFATLLTFFSWFFGGHH